MATQIIRKVVDDIDPHQEADGTVAFSFDGVDYEIDLSSVNTDKFRSEMEDWINYARKVGKAKRTRSTSGSNNEGGPSGLPLAEIRAWAQKNGHTVADRGRVSAEIVRAYNASKGEAKPEAEKAEPAKRAPAKRGGAKSVPAPEETSPAFSAADN